MKTKLESEGRIQFNTRIMNLSGDTIIRSMADQDEARKCAELMAGSEPWITLGRKLEAAFAILIDPAFEVSVAMHGGVLVGFVVIDMRGILAGYIKAVCVDPAHRNRGIGKGLLRWAENRIYRESPNVFLLVSSFNLNAQRLYQDLGYELIGRLKDFVIPGHDELLMRKTRGPLITYQAPKV